MVRRSKSLMVICNSLGTGGAEKHTVSLVNGLHRKGWSIVLVYLSHSTDLLAELDEGLRSRAIYVHRRSYLDLAAVASIRRLLAQYRVSSILSVNQLPLLYSLLSRGLDRRIQLFSGWHTTKIPIRESVKFYLSAWWMFKFTTKVIYVCETQMNHWSSRWLHIRGRGLYIYNGIDVKKFVLPKQETRLEYRERLDIPQGALVLVSIAMLRPEKRHVDMVSALKRLVDKGFDVYLLCVGEGSERDSIILAAEELGLKRRVKLIGLVDDVQPYLAASDATLMLSNAIETFSIAVLESLSCGCPVVAYDIGGIREQIVADEQGVVLPFRDEGALVAAIERLQSQRHRLDKKRLHDYVAGQFSVDNMVQAYEELFLGENLLSEREN